LIFAKIRWSATDSDIGMRSAIPVRNRISGHYGVAREALHNISKYAHASRVRPSLIGSPEGVRISIQDDGAGFDPEAGRRHGLGIISMKERVRMVQGKTAAF
jgi:signal transduction histidine kinase